MCFDGPQHLASLLKDWTQSRQPEITMTRQVNRPVSLYAAKDKILDDLVVETITE
jgi:hypothetical protein